MGLFNLPPLAWTLEAQVTVITCFTLVGVLLGIALCDWLECRRMDEENEEEE
jgi:hypothetical protein